MPVPPTLSLLTGGTAPDDVAALRDAIVAGVRERYGVTLVPEPVAVGW